MAARKGQRREPVKMTAAEPQSKQVDEEARRKLTFGLELRMKRLRDPRYKSADDLAAALVRYLPPTKRISGDQVRNYELGHSSPRSPQQTAALEAALGLPEGTFADILERPRFPHADLEKAARAEDDIVSPSARQRGTGNASPGLVLGELAALHNSLGAVLDHAKAMQSRLEALEVRVDRLEPKAAPPRQSPRTPPIAAPKTRTPTSRR